MSNSIYLDSAATTQMHPEVINAMTESMQLWFGNPSSTHQHGRDARGKIENVRKRIAQLCGVTSAEIIFTSCGTEGNNLVLRSAVTYLGIKRIITSKLEHKCVAETTQQLKNDYNTEVEYLINDSYGNLDLNQLEELLKDEKPTIVSIMHANNEIGNLNDIEKIGNLCHKYNAFYHCDMVQTLGHFPINLSELPVDFASSSAHKYHGPKGAGFAYIKKGTGLKAQITGGGQERKMRSGTENVHGIIGMGKAFEMALENYENDKNYIQNLKNYTVNKLKEAFPSILFNGNSANAEKSLYTVLNVSLPFTNPLIGFELDMYGINISQGSACSSGATSTSPILQEILDEETIKNTVPLRISFSKYNSEKDIDYLVEKLLIISGS